MSVQIAVRLADAELERLDAAVARGAFPSRAAAVRAGLVSVLREEREARIAEAYRLGYAEHPQEEGVGEGTAHGLVEGSVANCDNVVTIPKTALAARRGALGPAETPALDDALRIALALDA